MAMPISRVHDLNLCLQNGVESRPVETTDVLACLLAILDLVPQRLFQLGHRSSLGLVVAEWMDLLGSAWSYTAFC